MIARRFIGDNAAAPRASRRRCDKIAWLGALTHSRGKFMAVQNVSIASMFGWITDTFKLVKRNFMSLIGASALTLALAMVMCIPLWLVMFVGMKERIQTGEITPGAFPMGGDMSMLFAAYGVIVVVGLLLFPPLLVGWLRLCRDADRGVAVSAFDIFKPYKDGPLWMRSIRFALLAFLIYIVIFGLFGLVFSGAIVGFMHDVAAQQAATLAGTRPPPPNLQFMAGFFLAYFCFLAVAMLLNFVYMVGFAEISLRTTPVIETLQLAVIGVFRNLLKLIVFLIALFMGMSTVIFIFALILGVLAALLSLISPILGLLVALIIYVPFLLCIYPLMFAGHYFVWKSILDGSGPEAVITGGSSVSV
jgi:hypothetical protein